MNYTVQKKGIYYTVDRYRLDNRRDAEHLAHLLNTLQNTQNTINDNNTRLDQIEKQIIQLKMTSRILEEELQTLEEVIKNDYTN